MANDPSQRAWFFRQSQRIQMAMVFTGLAALVFCACVGIGVMSLLTDSDDDDPEQVAAVATTLPASLSSTDADPTSTARPTEPPASLATPEPTTMTDDQTNETSAINNTPAPPTNTVEPPPPTATPEPQRLEVDVVEVVDGDTLKVMIDGQEQSVRLIGVDTPETVHPTEPVMCWGPEASAFTKQMVELAGNKVLLEKDVSETDQYSRLLRYVWLNQPDGTRMLNQELVSQGYAQGSTYPPDVKYQDLFTEATREAREAGRGLWGACGEFGIPQPTPTPEPTAPPVPPTATPVPPPPPTAPPVPPPPPPSAQCDPSYPDVCIPPISVSGDLDCGDIPFGRFTVLPPDPHGFDGNDNDGLGCESN